MFSLRETLSLAVAAVLLCGLVFGVPAVAQSPPSQAPDPYAERLRAFEEFVNASMKRDRIPGMTVGFFKDEYTWLKRPPMTDAGLEYVGAGVALYPKDAKLRELLGDFLARKGRPSEAAESYRAAYTIDPGLAKGLSADDYVAQRLKAAAEQKKN